jgi:protein-disulfide isomerase
LEPAVIARLFVSCLALFTAPTAFAQTFNAQEQAEIRAVVREYLVRNPDVLREALDALADRTSAERWQQIRSDPRDFAVGPADAPVTIVEFYDYRCAYCHAAMEWVIDLSRTRRDIRIVLKNCRS